MVDDFNTLYGKLQMTPFVGKCVIKESETKKPKFDDVLELQIDNITGYQFGAKLPKQMSSFYKKAVDNDRFKFLFKDCDGTFLVRNEEGGWTIYLCELKTSASKDNLLQAKDQIVSTYLKLVAQLSILQSYIASTIKVKGIIIAHAPTPEQKSRFKDMSNPADLFCTRITNGSRHIMPKEKNNQFWRPLRLPDMEFAFVTVPYPNQNHIINFESIR